MNIINKIVSLKKNRWMADKNNTKQEKIKDECLNG